MVEAVKQVSNAVTNGAKKLITDAPAKDALIKKSVKSTEFWLILLFGAVLVANDVWWHGAVTDTTINKLELLVGGWTGYRIFGKAIAYQQSNNKEGEK